MIAHGELNYIRISPNKVRQVIELIRYKDILTAQGILFNLNKRAKEHLVKLLKQVVNSAKQKGFSESELYISKLVCNPGPIWKRYKAAAFGRAVPIRRRTSHIYMEVDLKK
ncbi:MAG: 50S ribosomal protein L22 [Candidatus Omnitrophica bacterium]|nr:50S ribosomal protein L22 [Candidatus Omnitrophota bacterium]